jgi:hypothetical protein
VRIKERRFPNRRPSFSSFPSSSLETRLSLKLRFTLGSISLGRDRALLGATEAQLRRYKRVPKLELGSEGPGRRFVNRRSLKLSDARFRYSQRLFLK